jgi:membrane protease YdiL (CAAX protease family)
MNRQKAASTVRTISMGIMVILSLTQLIPSLEMASISVWVGLASFFIVEALAGTSGKKSGLRFSTMGSELKDRSIWKLIGLLVCIQILSVLAGHLIFGQAFIDYDMGRIFDVLNSESIVFLLVINPISSWGEEIAWRGFFLGKKPEKISFWLWAVISSVLFAMGHVSQHEAAIVLFGTSFNFISSLIFCRIFQKTDNCMISTAAHIIGNYAEILFILLVFWK